VTLRADRPRGATAAVLLVCVPLLSFLPVLGHDFLEWDDSFNVWRNPHLNPVTASHVLDFWRHPTAHHMYPLTSTTWALLALGARDASGALRPAPYHAANLLLHLAATLLVYRILLLLLGPNRPEGTPRVGPALAGALLFALHPVQVEPVAWVTGAKDCLSGVLSLAAVWQFLLLCADRSVPPRRRVARAALATLAFSLALFAKPTAVVLPLFALAARAGLRASRATGAGQAGSGGRAAPWPGAGWVEYALPAAWLLLLALPWAAATKYTQRDEVLEVVAPLVIRPRVALDSVAFYIYKLVFPFALGPDYGRCPIASAHRAVAPMAAVTWLVPLGLLVPVLCSARRRQALVVAAVFVTALLPVLGLVPFAHQAISTVADRYLYLAMLAPGLALAWTLQARPGPRCALAAALVLAVLGVRSNLQTRHWRDTIALFRHALAVNPHSALSNYNLGLAHAQRAELRTAVAYYRKALALAPRHKRAHNNLGNALGRMGRYAEAARHFSHAFRIDPSFAEAHYNLARVLDADRRPADAVSQYSRALSIDPGYLDAHYNLANLFFRRGHVDRAIYHGSEALKLDPTDKDVHNNLGGFLRSKGRLDDAIAHYSRAAALEPSFADAYYNLGVAFLEQGNKAAAIAHLQHALQLQPGMKEARRRLRALQQQTP